MHPNWYYDLYDEIFAWSRDYSKEIMMINDIVSLKNKIVEEIGAGTGKHTEHILKMNPFKVEAIDYDNQAIELLKKKFGHISNVQIVNEDGFFRENKVDVIICLYSIFQQSENESILRERVKNFINRIERYDCHIFVECIDTTKHNAQGFTLLYESGAEYLGIKSEKTDFGVKIIYQGYINKMDTTYEVPICHFPSYLFELYPNIKYEIIPLTQSGRKRILHIFK